jgi:outer membrane protein assembly factor BamC
LPRFCCCCSRVAGGSLLEPKRIEYKTASATKVPTLEVPPDLTSPTRDDRYAVPDTIGKGTATYSAYTAERSPQARAQQKSEVLPEVETGRTSSVRAISAGWSPPGRRTSSGGRSRTSGRKPVL